MNTGIRNRVYAYIKENNMIEAGDRVVAGVSGGSDSVCLLILLAELRTALPFSLEVVHVNHGIREEAGEDAAFVQALCARLGIVCHVYETDVRAAARQARLSEEEAGRNARYEAFRQALAGQKGKIAVAHNENDRAETLLFHLFRGSGLDGMASIRPVREDVIRPLLCLKKEEIEGFLREEGQCWCVDRTNLGNDYARNRIRHQILPAAETGICSAAVRHLAEASELMQQTAAYLKKQTEEALARCSEDRREAARAETAGREVEAARAASAEIADRTEAAAEDTAAAAGSAAPAALVWRRFFAEAFLREDRLLQGLMLRDTLQCLGGARDLGRRDVEAAVRLFLPRCQSGRRLRLNRGRVLAVREFGSVVFSGSRGEREGAEQREKSGRTIPLTFPDGGEGFRVLTAEVPGLGVAEARLFAWDEAARKEAAARRIFENIEENKYTKWLDYDKIMKHMEFRERRTGDYLTVNDALQKKSLKSYLIQEKVPASERDGLMLLADGDHIIWMPGHRISAAYKITEETRTVLEIRIRGGNTQV